MKDRLKLIPGTALTAGAAFLLVLDTIGRGQTLLALGRAHMPWWVTPFIFIAGLALLFWYDNSKDRKPILYSPDGHPVRQRVAKSLFSRALVGLLIGVVLAGIALIIDRHVDRAEVTQTHAVDSLIVTALATNVTYPVGSKHGGIEWRDGYAELRVDIKYKDEGRIEKLEIKLKATNQAEFFDVGQLSNVPDVHVDHPDTVFPGKNIQIQGTNGEKATIPLNDAFDFMKWPASQWTVFCPVLLSNEPLKLVMAELVDGSRPKETKTLNLSVTGTYEIVRGGSTQIATLDRIVPVEGRN